MISVSEDLTKYHQLPLKSQVSSSGSPCASGRPVTAELWSGNQTCWGLTRSCSVEHSWQEQTEFTMAKGRQETSPSSLSIYQLESRKSIRLRKNTDTLEGTGGKSVFSQLSHRLLNQLYLWPKLGSKTGFRPCNPGKWERAPGFSSHKEQGCQTSRL